MEDLIKLRLGDAKTVQDAQQIWRTFPNELQGCTFVLASSQPSPFHFPARADLPGYGFLRSVFAYDYLQFLPDESADTKLSGTTRGTKATYSVSFDLNTASHLRSLSSGHSNPDVHRLLQAISSLSTVFGDAGFRWDYFPYLMERADDLVQGRDVSYIHETVLACERLAACDLAKLRQNGSLTSRVDEAELQRRAQLEIDSCRQQLRNGLGDEIRHRFNLFYLFVLKTVIIHLIQPGQRAASTKLETLIEFLDGRLGCLPQLAATAAAEFFIKGSRFAPFAKVASRKPNLKKDAKNIAWDFLHLQIGQEFTGFHAPNGAFLVRYFLTFDRGLKDLFDVFPHRSCLVRPRPSFPWFFADFDYPSQMMGQFPELGAVMTKHFVPGADHERSTRLQATPPDVPKLIAELESEIDHL